MKFSPAGQFYPPCTNFFTLIDVWLIANWAMVAINLTAVIEVTLIDCCISRGFPILLSLNEKYCFFLPTHGLLIGSILNNIFWKDAIMEFCFITDWVSFSSLHQLIKITLYKLVNKNYFWEEECDFDMFPLVRKLWVKEMILIIIEHLTCLENRIEEYSPSINTHEFDWIHNPFINLTNPPNFELYEVEELATRCILDFCYKRVSSYS